MSQASTLREPHTILVFNPKTCRAVLIQDETAYLKNVEERHCRISNVRMRETVDWLALNDITSWEPVEPSKP